MRTPLGSFTRLTRIAILPLIGLSAACATAGRAQRASAPAWHEPQGSFAWTQYGSDGRLWVRAVTSESACPTLELAGPAGAAVGVAAHSAFVPTAVQMSVRAAPQPDFPKTVCEARVPAGATQARVGGVSLSLGSREPRRVLILGDTGCRMKKDKSGKIFAQACNDPEAWPFAQLSARAAALKPDLVIHLGDYFYREAPCPDSEPGCAGSPAGDRWESWVADFLEPAQPLLASAPWVMVRGNHENCERGAKGWFSLLDAFPRLAGETASKRACSDRTAPYRVPLGARDSIAVLDSSDAPDLKSSPEDVAHFGEQLVRIGKMRPAPSWIVTHKPFWAPEPKRQGVAVEHPDFLNHTLDAAAKHLPASTAQIFAGHIHAFELLQFREGGPLQWVIGNGGTLIDKHQEVFADMKLGHKTVARGESLEGFGFLVLDRRTESDWDATAYDASGTRLAGWRCQLDFKHGPTCQ